MNSTDRIVWMTEIQQKTLENTGILTIKPFRKGEQILDADPGHSLMGVVLSGTLYLESLNQEGQRRILNYYTAQDLFSQDHFSPQFSEAEVLTAKTPGHLAMLREGSLPTDPNRKRSALSFIPTEILLASFRRIYAHLHVLGQHSLEQKLLTALRYLAGGNAGKPCDLPMPWTDFADYLAVDRSAMMRQLSIMKSQGILKTEGRHFTLLP